MHLARWQLCLSPIVTGGRRGGGWRWQVAVGRMAHWEEHWEAIQTWLGQEQVIPWNSSLPAMFAHESSKDPLGTTAAAKTAIAKDPAVQRALCFILLPDFINFGCAGARCPSCGSVRGVSAVCLSHPKRSRGDRTAGWVPLTANGLARWSV